jgi:uncharacterized protein DUF6152
VSTVQTAWRHSVIANRMIVTALGIALFALSANAHHSIVGAYDNNQPITIEGIVKQFHFVNPHPFLTLEVKNANGAAEQWQGELDNRWELVEVGMTATTIKSGDKVIVRGSRGRVQTHNLYVRRLDRPADGFWYEQVGFSPRIR